MARVRCIKVRFHLGAGKHFKHWRIQYPNGVVQYVHPDSCQLHLIEGELRNGKKTAQKIFDGGEKVVCAWVLCEEVRCRDMIYGLSGEAITYNPRVTPNWVFNGKNADGHKFGFIYSIGNKLFVK
jgi:hypothetical protein